METVTFLHSGANTKKSRATQRRCQVSLRTKCPTTRDRRHRSTMSSPCLCCVVCLPQPLCLINCSLCTCVFFVSGQDTRVDVCACLLVHERHCFKRSSYWNGKERREAGAAELATSGGKREQERQEQNPFVISVDC